MSALTVLAERKQSLRREVRERLASVLRPDLKSTWDRKIQNFLQELLPSDGGFGAAFVGLADEPSLQESLTKMKDWRWAWPRVVGEALVFHLANSEPDQWQRGRFEILEPKSSQPVVSLSGVNAVCVPGLGFDRTGRRLGRGKGYYDRALQNYGGLKIGVGYSAQVINEELPNEAHDVRMDFLVTEEFILKPKG